MVVFNIVKIFFQAHSSLVENKDRDSQKLNSQTMDQKSFVLNQITQVSIMELDHYLWILSSFKCV